MTALLDPAQIEERERRRLKQLEQQVGGGERGRNKARKKQTCMTKYFQKYFYRLSSSRLLPQRAIEAQVEERRQQREREEARRREEEEEEERRLEREMLERRYELDALKERRKVRTHTVHGSSPVISQHPH